MRLLEAPYTDSPGDETTPPPTTSLEDAAAEDGPETMHRIQEEEEEENRSGATFNLPGSSPNNSDDESSIGWSDSEGLSSETYDDDDEEAIVEHHQQQKKKKANVVTPQEIEQSLMASGGDGLLLLSDDEMDIGGGDNYQSESALSLTATPNKRSTYHHNSDEDDGGSGPQSPSHPHRSGGTGCDPTSKIPTCVALGDLPFADDDDCENNLDDPSRSYNARYDGSLQDLTQDLDSDDASYNNPTTNSYDGDDNYNDSKNDDDDDDADSDDSSMEMASYLSTASGDKREPDVFLRPYVGERPPTPPSPCQKSRTSKNRTKQNKTASDSPTRPPTERARSAFHSPSSSNRSPPRVDSEKAGSIINDQCYKPTVSYSRNDETSNYDMEGDSYESTTKQLPPNRRNEDTSNGGRSPSSQKQGIEVQLQQSEEQFQEALDKELSNAMDGNRYNPAGGSVDQTRAVSAITLEDDRTMETIATLTKAREEDRRLIRLLAWGLGCAVMMLAIIMVGVLVLLIVKTNDSVNVTPVTVPAPTRAPTIVPAPQDVVLTRTLAPTVPPITPGNIFASMTTTPTVGPTLLRGSSSVAPVPVPTARPTMALVPAPIVARPTMAPATPPTAATVPTTNGLVSPSSASATTASPTDGFGSVVVP